VVYYDRQVRADGEREAAMPMIPAEDWLSDHDLEVMFTASDTEYAILAGGRLILPLFFIAAKNLGKFLTTPRALIWSGGSHFTFCGYGPLATGTAAEIKEVTKELYQQAAEVLIGRYRAECNREDIRKARRGGQALHEINLDANQVEPGKTRQQNEVGHERNEVAPSNRATRKKESAEASQQKEMRKVPGLSEGQKRSTADRASR
jgi:hypothetical protein